MKKVCIFCAETVKENVQLLLNIFFHVEDFVSAPRCTSVFFLKNVRLLLKDINGR